MEQLVYEQSDRRTSECMVSDGITVEGGTTVTIKQSFHELSNYTQVTTHVHSVTKASTVKLQSLIKC